MRLLATRVDGRPAGDLALKIKPDHGKKLADSSQLFPWAEKRASCSADIENLLVFYCCVNFVLTLQHFPAVTCG